MKNLIHLIALSVLFTFLQSCNECNCPPENKKIMFDGKYVKGTVVALPKVDELGFIEIGIDHDNSFLCLYKESSFSGFKLFDEIYIKANYIDSIPLAFEITDIKPSDSEIAVRDVTTNISYHSFNDHGKGSSFHRIGHIWSLTSNDSEIGIRIGTKDTILRIEPELKRKAETYRILNVDDRVYIKVNNAGKIIEIDTCHKHGNRIIKCRHEEQ